LTNKLSLLLILLFALFVTGCSSTSKNSENSVKEDSMTVDIRETSIRSVPKISKKRSLEAFGPLPESPSDLVVDQKTTANGPSALVLSAGGYRAISTISLLRELKIIDKVPPVLLSHGLSAVVASYFAFGFEADFIEWKFFQFFEKVKDLKPYTREWAAVFEEVLIQEIEKENIEAAKLTLIIPVWNVVKRKAEFIKRGPLKEALMANINFFGILQDQNRPAVGYMLIDKPLLTSLGIKKIYVLDLLTSGISWKTGNGLLNGFFQRGASVILNEKSNVDVIIEFPVSEFELDDLTRMADLIFLSKALAKTHLSEFTKEEDL